MTLLYVHTFFTSTKHACPASREQWLRIERADGEVRYVIRFFLDKRHPSRGNPPSACDSLWSRCNGKVPWAEVVSGNRKRSGKRSGRPSASAEHVEDMDAAVRADRRVWLATGTQTESFAWHNVGHCSRASRLPKRL